MYVFLSNYGQVGEFQITKTGWDMCKSSSLYFQKKNGNYKRGKVNPFTINTGNCS